MQSEVRATYGGGGRNGKGFKEEVEREQQIHRVGGKGALEEQATREPVPGRMQWKELQSLLNS